jgi:hypothetical protein
MRLVNLRLFSEAIRDSCEPISTHNAVYFLMMARGNFHNLLMTLPASQSLRKAVWHGCRTDRRSIHDLVKGVPATSRAASATAERSLQLPDHRSPEAAFPGASGLIIMMLSVLDTVYCKAYQNF